METDGASRRQFLAIAATPLIFASLRTEQADEATLYRLAGQLEQARPWRKKIPPAAL